jgi:ParB/RepB/Spo0J family partition protein
MNRTEKSPQCFEVEWHQLDLRYQSLRICTKKTQQRLMMSIHTYGQLIPITVISSSLPDRLWTVIDGYLRIAAMKNLGKDLIIVKVLELDAPEALLHTYSNNESRSWEALEEANLLQELIASKHYSQAQLAEKIGKSEAWVTHRLQLIQVLPDFVKEIIYQGTLSSWVASRILVPFARANQGHAKQFVNYLSTSKHTSRELQSFYEHYLRVNKKNREQMVTNPTLFFKADKLAKHDASLKPTHCLPEQLWETKITQITDCLNALSSLLPVVFYPQQTAGERSDLEKQFQQVVTMMNELQQAIKRKNNGKTSHCTDGAEVT